MKFSQKQLKLIGLFSICHFFLPFALVKCGGEDIPYIKESGNGSDLDVTADCESNEFLTKACSDKLNEDKKKEAADAAAADAAANPPAENDTTTPATPPATPVTPETTPAAGSTAPAGATLTGKTAITYPYYLNTQEIIRSRNFSLSPEALKNIQINLNNPDDSGDEDLENN